MKKKTIIYQLLPRIFGNSCDNNIPDGTREQNGCGKFNDITEVVIAELKSLGITHIWLTGIIRHATLSHYPQYGLSASHPDIVKGKAGSPYAVNDYYDIDPDLAVDIPSRMKEFLQLILRIHEQDLKVIIDFVPNHVARDYRSIQRPEDRCDLGETDNSSISFSPSNNFYYFPGEYLSIRGLQSKTSEYYEEFPAKATGNDIFRPDPDINDWYETVKLNYGIDYKTGQQYFHPLPDTWIKMTEVLLFWAEKGVDGFRCDMAGMVPVNFWQYAISQIRSEYPKIYFIAELYEPPRYREYVEIGFFDFLYDKVGLYDSLRSVIEEKAPTSRITSVWQSLEGMDDVMLRFLENHDEQRIASKQFAGDPWKAFPGMVIATLMNQGPVLIYAGQEVGEPASGRSGFSGDDGRTTIFDYASVPELCKWFNGGKCDSKGLSENQQNLRKAYADLFNLMQRFPVFSNGRFYDLMWVNGDNPHRDKIFAFLRYGGTEEEEVFLVVASFDPSIRVTNIKISEHALQTIGFETRMRITVKSVVPEESTMEVILLSQLITIGVPVRINPTGYSIISLT